MLYSSLSFRYSSLLFMKGDSTTLIVTSSFTYYENFLTIVFGHPKLRVYRKWFNFETCIVFTWRRGCCCWLLVIGYCWLLVVVVVGYWLLLVAVGCRSLLLLFFGCCCFCFVLFLLWL